MPNLASSIASRRPAPFPSAPSHADEDYINRSLLDSLNAQADAEPDSEGHNGSIQTMGSIPPNSAVGSPPIPYSSSLPSQQQPGSGPESPGAGNMLSSYLTSPSHNADSFAQVGSQKTNNSYQMYNSINNGIHPPLGPDFASVLPSEHDVSALNSQTSANGFSSPTGPLRTFNPFSATSNGRPRHNTATIRDTPGSFPTSPSYPPVQQQDIYISNPTSLNQQPNPASAPSLDAAHHRFDYSLSAPQSAPSLALPTKQPAFSAMDAYRLGLEPLAHAQQMRQPGILGNVGTNGILQREPQASLLNQHANGMPAHLNGLTHALSHQNALQSQGSFGTNGPTQATSSVVNGAAHGGSQQQPQEEISTIFVVGFPDDMSVSMPLFYFQSLVVYLPDLSIKR